MRHTYETSQWVPFRIDQVFAFFCDPANLPRLMPDWQRARIDHATLVAPEPAGAHAGAAGEGSTLKITFRALPFLPIRLTWLALISEFAWNDHFCDEQTRGPLAYWKHCHHISTETRDHIAGSLVKDHVTYALPFGPLGDLANAIAIRFQMKATFAYRQRRLLQLLSSQGN